MANFIENFGLDFLTKTEDDTAKLISVLAQEGKAILGYYGFPYLNKRYGDAQFIVRTRLDHEKKQPEVTGLDTHSSGRCIWNARLAAAADVTPKNADVTERRCILARQEDGNGMAIVNIVNADVLPSFLPDDPIALQMIAFPVSIEYFENEGAYADSQEKWRGAKKWLLADGTLFPSGFMFNHDPGRPEEEKNDALDDHMLLRGTVKNLYHGILQFGEKKHNGFIRCMIDTQYGELELVHTYEQVPEKLRGNIKKGSIVSGIFVLSGDAAIYDYQAGFIKDEEHHLRALRYNFVKGEAERMRYILAEDAVYTSQATGKEIHGSDAVIEHFQDVHGANAHYFAHMATIVSVDGSSTEGALKYHANKRCVVLAANREDNYESIVFIDLNADNRIARIELSTNGRYRFRIDAKLRTGLPLDDVKLPETALNRF